LLANFSSSFSLMPVCVFLPSRFPLELGAHELALLLGLGWHRFGSVLTWRIPLVEGSMAGRCRRDRKSRASGHKPVSWSMARR